MDFKSEFSQMEQLSLYIVLRIKIENEDSRGSSSCFHFLRVIIIIINLFQEDNIFGMDASLTYGPQIQRHRCV